MCETVVRAERKDGVLTCHFRFARALAQPIPIAIALIGAALITSGGVISLDATPRAEAPVISPATGSYKTKQTVSITNATPGAKIYYTTDGATPNTASTRYTGPFIITASETVRASATADGYSISTISAAKYTIITETPVISPARGAYAGSQTITITDITSGAVIYYTLNGRAPNASSPVYSGPFTIFSNSTIQAVAKATGDSASSVVSASYSFPAATPVIRPASGTYLTAQPVTINTSTPGAFIYFTTDGSTPTSASDFYDGPFTVSTNQKIQAIAVAKNYDSSSLASSTYTITPHAPAPTFSPAPGTVTLPGGILAQATVNTTPQMTVPPNFMGLSTGWQTTMQITGQASTGVNEAYRALLSNITQYYTAPMLLRIEGDNAQASDLQGDIEPLAELAQAVNVNYTLGVDLWNNDVATAEAEASAWMNGIPNGVIQAFEIGNEPDNYPYQGARPSSYAFPQYLAQFEQWQQGIQSVTGNSFGVVGPSYAGAAWEASSESALVAGTLTPYIVSQHAYLAGPTPGQTLPSDYLLLPHSAVGIPLGYSKYAAAAHQAGRIFRMGEINSIGGGGVAGISDTFSSALWSIDIMFNYLINGMDGVNWHSGQYTRYALFEFKPYTYNGTTTFPLVQVNPLYYGLLVFAQMAGRDAKLLPVTTVTNSNVSIWATVDNTSTAHVIVINKDETDTGDVQITLPGYTTGTVRYLSAANYSATNGVTLGGQTFDGSTDGTIQGSPTSTTITAQDGKFTLSNMSVTTAAVIDFSN